MLGSLDVERSLPGIGEHIYRPIRTDRDPAFFVNTGARARFGARGARRTRIPPCLASGYGVSVRSGRKW